MFLHENDQKMTMFNYFGPRILFVRPERTVGNNGIKWRFPEEKCSAKRILKKGVKKGCRIAKKK